MVSPRVGNYNLIGVFIKYIYDNTLLYIAFNISFDNFNKQTVIKRINIYLF